MFNSFSPKPGASLPVEWAIPLPGPNRKRLERAYIYRLKYLNLGQDKSGCLMTWEVEGGRLIYQIAVEREQGGGLRCHCTCADAIYRAEEEGRYCKHVRGFLNWYQANPGGGEALPTGVRLGA
jgi:hypothetical protein